MLSVELAVLSDEFLGRACELRFARIPTCKGARHLARSQPCIAHGVACTGESQSPRAAGTGLHPINVVFDWPQSPRLTPLQEHISPTALSKEAAVRTFDLGHKRHSQENQDDQTKCVARAVTRIEDHRAVGRQRGWRRARGWPLR